VLIPVVRSGGAGTRLWPVSREGHPKPFMRLPEVESLLDKNYAPAVACEQVSEVLTVTNREEELLMINTNQSTCIPAGHRHRLENPGVIDLVMIEMQSGEYLGENGIVRFRDSYGRV
jgi:mannose-1-phosphate guanylyltransferase